MTTRTGHRTLSRSIASGLALISILCFGVAADAAVDLRLKALTVKTFPGNDAVDFEVEVCNEGTVGSGPFSVALYHHRDIFPPCGTPGDETWQIANLAPGSCTTRFDLAIRPDGSFVALAIVDHTCSVAEGNESNNSLGTSYTVAAQPLPDYEVAGVAVNSQSDHAYFTVTVCNRGHGSAAPLQVALYYDRAARPACGDGDHKWTVAGLDQGKCATLTHAGPPASPKQHTAWAFADAGCTIGEASETNNASWATYHGTATIDLRVDALVAQVYGDQVAFSATVCNHGTGTVGQFAVALHYHRPTAPPCGTAGDTGWGITGLSATQCRTVSHIRPATAAGSYQALAVADAPCAVQETLETNNTRAAAYSVSAAPAPAPDGGAPPPSPPPPPPPDAGPAPSPDQGGSPSPTPDLLLAALTAEVQGTQVVYRLLTCNVGTVASGPFALALDFDAAAEPPCGAIGDQRWTAHGLDPGVCAEQVHSRADAPPGHFTAWARADAPCTLSESAEQNNAARADYSVTAVAGPVGPAAVDAGPGWELEPAPAQPVGTEGCAVDGTGGARGVGCTLLLALLLVLRHARRRRRAATRLP